MCVNQQIANFINIVLIMCKVNNFPLNHLSITIEIAVDSGDKNKC